MKSRTLFIEHLVPLSLALCLGITVSGCGSDEGDSKTDDSESDESPDPTDTGEPSDTGDGEEGDDAIGNPIGDPVAIDHATALGTVQDNLSRHIDGLENSLLFLETSDAANNLVDMLFGEDDEDEDEEWEEGMPEEAEDEEEEDEDIDIDFSEMRDDLLEIMADKIMVEETSTVADDGLSISYQLSPDHFCAEDPEEDESPEDEADRLEDEVDCAERLAENPVEIVVMSDGEGDMNLSILAGDGAIESLRLQIHDDMMAVITELPNITPMVEVFVDPEDFEMPRTMEGIFGAEIREDGPLTYTARFAVLEAIHVESADDQDQLSLEMPEDKDPGRITIDGSALTMAGTLSIEELEASMPWQIVVDMFYDDEGHSEWICETDEWGEEDCWEEWIDAPEAPEVDEAIIVALPVVNGTLEYSADDDTFRFNEIGLGDSTTIVSVDADTIVSLDLNPDDGRTLDLAISSNADEGIGFEFSPVLDAQASFEWHKVSEVFEDLPSWLLDETVGVRFDSSSAPRLDILRGEDEEGEELTELRSTSGQLTLWSSEMDEDVVIGEGECITSVDEETLSEEEREAQHDLFGGLMGDACEI